MGRLVRESEIENILGMKTDVIENEELLDVVSVPTSDSVLLFRYCMPFFQPRSPYEIRQRAFTVQG